MHKLFALIAAAMLCGCGDPLADLNSGKVWTGYAQLNSKDPLRHAWDFLRADYGGILQGKEVRNAGSHLDYGTYYSGELTVGIQGGERGAIVDLGTDDALATRLKAEQTGGGGQGFSHLEMTEGGFNDMIADTILEKKPSEWSMHLVAKESHVYVLRIVDPYDDALDLIVKLLVVRVDADIVEFQWVRLL